MLKLCTCCVFVGLILLSSPHQFNAQPTQANSRAKPQQANSQPSVTPLNNSNSAINNSANAASASQNQERDPKDEAFKTEQLRQNRITEWATVFIAIFGCLSFLAALIYALVSIKQWKAIEKQATHSGEQVGKMQEQLGIMKDTLAAGKTQMEIAATAVRVAERSAIAAEQHAQIAIEEVRPHLEISATAHHSDTNPTIEVYFKNVGGSQATVSGTYVVSIFGSEQFIKADVFSPFTIAPGNRPETKRIEELDARQFDLVVRAGGRLTLKIVGHYEGVGGPFSFRWCRKWDTGRSTNAIDGPCDEADDNPTHG